MPQKALKLSADAFDTAIQQDTHGKAYLGQAPRFALGKIATADCLEWLKTVPSKSVDLVFADPPYNIGKAAWDSFDSHDAYVIWCLGWIQEAARVLKDSGSLFVCGYTEILANFARSASSRFSSFRWLIWYYKNRANLGKDFGRSHESILHLRQREFRLNIDGARIPYGQHTLKYPVHPQAASSDFAGDGQERHEWSPNPLSAKPKDVIEIPTTSNGMAEKTPHPTQKPEELLRRLIAVASKPGEIVVDPFSGSGTTAVCAEQLQRLWSANDLNAQYNGWAAYRLARVSVRDADYWADYDRRVAQRREAIR